MEPELRHQPMGAEAVTPVYRIVFNNDRKVVVVGEPEYVTFLITEEGPVPVWGLWDVGDA